MTDRLHDWEIATIDALGDEHLENERRKQNVRFPDRFRDKWIAELQADTLRDSAVRRQLAYDASRLGIGIAHPKPYEEDDHEKADPHTSGRWARMIGLVLRLPAEHPWRELHRELVTRPLIAHKHDREPCDYRNQGLDILQVLEDEAAHHGLIVGDAKPISAEVAIDALSAGMAGGKAAA